LQEAGTVLHLARSGRLIVKAASQVEDGTLLVDEGGKRTGRVMETIGPVSSPYLSIQPMTDRVERLVGAKLFVVQSSPRESSERRPSRFSGKIGSFRPGKRSQDRTRRSTRKQE
jgi:rRNA processing protein Gar1